MTDMTGVTDEYFNLYNHPDESCLLCGTISRYGIFNGGEGKFYQFFECKICSRYNLELQQAQTIGKHPQIKAYLRCKSRNYSGGMEDGFRIDEDDTRLENLSVMPASPLEGMDNILVWIAEKIASQDELVKIDPSTDYPIFYSKSEKELTFWLETAKDLNLLELKHTSTSTDERYRLKIEGWKRYEEQKRSNNKLSLFVFIAKSFDPSLEVLYTDGIEPALVETGFKAIYLNNDKRSGLIDNKIIAGIKQSRFVIADYTLQRAGVYYEAGYATGLGIPVIDCCKRDHFDKIHFDKQHHTVILWDTPLDLKTQLIDAIKANVL